MQLQLLHLSLDMKMQMQSDHCEELGTGSEERRIQGCERMIM